MKIENMKLEELMPYENNPRKNDHAVEPVAESIKDFGFRVPILVDKDNVIIAGHTRYLAAKKLGLAEVPVIREEDMTEAQVAAFRLVDNKTNEFSAWDFDKLDVELEKIKEMDDALDLKPFAFEDFASDDDLNDMFTDVPETEDTNKKEKTVVCPNCGHEFTP